MTSISKSELLTKYPSEVMQIISWIKMHSKSTFVFPTLYGGIPELFGDNDYRCQTSWETKLKEIGINVKNPQRHKELIPFLIIKRRITNERRTKYITMSILWSNSKNRNGKVWRLSRRKL
jgi:hypothetical protein